MDGTNEQIILMLKDNGRATFIEIAEKLGLSEGAIRSRVKKLMDDGIIEKFTVNVKDNISAIVMVSTVSSVPTANVSRAIKKIGIGRVYEISGSYDIICFIEAEHNEQLNDMIEKIRTISGVSDTQTNIVLH